MKKLLLILLVILSFTSCKKVKEQDASTLLISLSGEVSTLDPANAYDTISGSVIYQCYEQLFQYHYLKRPYTIIPLLAENLPEVSADGKTYTIKIKKGVKYHNDESFSGQTRYVQAQDFVNQIKRLAFKPTNSNGWWLFNNKIIGLNKFREEAGESLEKFETLNVEGLTTPDEHTLIIKLKEPYPQMLYALAMSFTSPMPLEAIKHYKNILNEKIIGTGPYYLQDWQYLGGVKLKRNPDYREDFYPSQGDRLANSKGLLKSAGKKIPSIENVEFKIIKESQTRWLNFRSKKVDFIIIPKDNFSTAIDENGNLSKELSNENIRLQISPTLTYWWLSFNMTDELLGKNVKLRKAIAHAIDFDTYIKNFTNNIGQKANSIYPPGVTGYNPSNKLPYEYNVEKAKKYLAEAGYPNGIGLPELIYDVRGTSVTNRQQAEYIKKELSKIGINVKTVLNSFPSFLDKSRKGKLQFWQDGWAMDYPDAENSLQLLYSKNHAPGPNATFYANKEFDELFDQMKILPSGPDKEKLLIELENIINSDLPWVMQYYARNYILIHDRLKNYRHSDLIYNNIKYLRLNNQ